jgi:hypothetical protein
MRQERKERDENERVPSEVDPLDVELADDSLSSRAGKMQHVDLDHLRGVLEEMSGLGEREESEKSDPWRRDEAVGVSRRARRHP